MTDGLEILGLDEHDPRMEADLYPLLRHLRPNLTRCSFDALISEGYAQGLRYLVAYRSDGTPQAAAGYRVIATSRGRILFLDDLVTYPGARSEGIGAALLDAVEVIGRESNRARPPSSSTRAWPTLPPTASTSPIA